MQQLHTVKYAIKTRCKSLEISKIGKRYSVAAQVQRKQKITVNKL